MGQFIAACRPIQPRTELKALPQVPKPNLTCTVRIVALILIPTISI